MDASSESTGKKPSASCADTGMERQAPDKQQGVSPMGTQLIHDRRTKVTLLGVIAMLAASLALII